MENIKIKPLKPILQLTYPKTGPEKNESNYRESLTVTKLIKPRQEWDKARNSVALDLVHAQQELSVAKDELKEVKAKAKVEFKECDQAWKDLEVKQKNFRRNFIKFDRFVKENQDKRERAIKKLKAEGELGVEYDMMRAELKERYDVLVEIKIQFEDNWKLYKMYDDFLMGVNYLVPTLKDPDDIILKHRTLIEMKDEILKARNQLFDDLDGLKAQNAKMAEQHMLDLLSHNGKIVDLICRHESARNKALMWETVVAKIRQQAEMKIAEMDSVKVGIWELYKIMCDRRVEPVGIEKENFEEQAMYVKKTLWTLNKINQRLSRQKAQDTAKAVFDEKKRSNRRVAPKRSE